MTPPSLTAEDHDQVRILRLTHRKANALDIELCDAIIQALDDAREAQAVVITGSGTIFSAGVDLVRIVDGGGAAYVREFLPRLREVFRRVAFEPKPVVAAVNGHAIAGGFILLAAADRAVAARGGGKLGVTELLVGLPFPAIAMELLRARAGVWTPEMAYLGRTYDVTTAAERRLVDEVAEDCVGRAAELAGSLAATGAAFSITKSQLRQPIADAIAARGGEQDQAVDAVWTSQSALEAIRAYVDLVIRRP